VAFESVPHVQFPVASTAEQVSSLSHVVPASPQRQLPDTQNGFGPEFGQASPKATGGFAPH
jgi:hypothetical protein